MAVDIRKAEVEIEKLKTEIKLNQELVDIERLRHEMERALEQVGRRNVEGDDTQPGAEGPSADPGDAVGIR